MDFLKDIIPWKRRPFRILSIDGGGFRGLLPATLLVKIEEDLNHLSGQDGRIGDYFDFIAGTSIGGILGALYLLPDRPRGDHLHRFGAKDGVEFLKKNKSRIFNPYSSLYSVGGFWGPRYPANEAERVFRETFKAHHLSDLRKDCLITSYHVNTMKPTVFMSRAAREAYNNLNGSVSDSRFDPELRNGIIRASDYYLYDILRATSAAPTYFEPATIRPHFKGDTSWIVEKREKETYIDGGIFTNNPALITYIFTRLYYDFIRKDHSNMYILSLGTGLVQESYSVESMKTWGVANWAEPVVNMMMDGESYAVDAQLNQIFRRLNSREQNQHYLRINPQLTYGKNIGHNMDLVTDEHEHELQNLALKEYDLRKDEIIHYLRRIARKVEHNS